MLEPGKDAVRAELAGHDPGEEPQDDPDVKHLRNIPGAVEIEVIRGETRYKGPVELVCSVEIDPKREIDDHHVHDSSIGPFAPELEVMLEIGDGDNENIPQI